MGNVYVCKSVCVQVDGQDKQHLSSMLTAQTLNRPNRATFSQTATVSIFNKLFRVVHAHQIQLTVNMTWPAIPENHPINKTRTPF